MPTLMMCVRADVFGHRKLAKRSYIWELQECLRETVDPRCAVYTVYDNHGRPHVLVDVPCPSAVGRPFSRFVYSKGRTHEQIAKGVYNTVRKYPGSFLPSIYNDDKFFMDKWVQW